MQPGDVALLENLRFHAAEEANDPDFARQLAALADLYVDDAFGTAHRAHASTEGVNAFLPSVAGRFMERELQFPGRAFRRIYVSGRTRQSSAEQRSQASLKCFGTS